MSKLTEACIIGKYCARHEAVHGVESERLRAQMAELAVWSEDPRLKELTDDALDEIDAADSLAYLETRHRTLSRGSSKRRMPELYRGPSFSVGLEEYDRYTGLQYDTPMFRVVMDGQLVVLYTYEQRVANVLARLLDQVCESDAGGSLEWTIGALGRHVGAIVESCCANEKNTEDTEKD